MLIRAFLRGNDLKAFLFPQSAFFAFPRLCHLKPTTATTTWNSKQMLDFAIFCLFRRSFLKKNNYTYACSEHIYPSSFWLLYFIASFITKTTTNHYQDAHYSLSEQGTSPYLSLAINYQLKIKRFFLSHLTLLFSIQSTFRERRFTIHLKYFLQFYPLKFGGFKKK